MNKRHIIIIIVAVVLVLAEIIGNNAYKKINQDRETAQATEIEQVLSVDE